MRIEKNTMITAVTAAAVVAGYGIYKFFTREKAVNVILDVDWQESNNNSEELSESDDKE